jgi:hypothetical protein
MENLACSSDLMASYRMNSASGKLQISDYVVAEFISAIKSGVHSIFDITSLFVQDMGLPRPLSGGSCVTGTNHITLSLDGMITALHHYLSEHVLREDACVHVSDVKVVFRGNEPTFEITLDEDV